MNVMRRKVLHVIDSLDLGGAQTLLLDLVRHYDRSRLEIHVACMHGRGVFLEAFEAEGVPVHSLSPSKWPPLYLVRFPKLLATIDPDILHFHLFGSNLIAKPLAALLSWRALICHDHCNDAGRSNPALLFADTLSNRLSSRVIAVSETIRSFLLERECLDPDRVITLGNSVDISLFKEATPEERDQARALFGIPLDAFVIGGVGRLVPQKNFDLFLEVAALVAASRPEALFVIAGTGPREADLKAKAVRLGLSDRVRFLGHVENRAGLYHALDVLVMASDFEGTPMVLLEAMASGLPIIASAVDGIAEVCSDGEDALLVSPGRVHEFASALGSLIADPGLGQRLGRNARQSVLEGYDIRGLARRVEQVYDAVLAEHG
jgi:glycosyltransferase involved in cell wall biosynthesis